MFFYVNNFTNEWIFCQDALTYFFRYIFPIRLKIDFFCATMKEVKMGKCKCRFMMDFQKLGLEHISLLKGYFSEVTTRLCDTTLGGAVMWRKGFDTELANTENVLFLRSRPDEKGFVYTVPLGNLERGVELLTEYCRERGEPLRFCSVSREDKDRLLDLLPGFTARPTRDWFDYLYRAEKLSTLAGKKLAGQRNHRNFFLKNHPDWRFEEITDENITEVREFFRIYCRENQKDSEYFRQEVEAVREVLEKRDLYGFVGGLIRAEGKLCAFSFGEHVGDTLFVHIEKADRTVRGSYQMMASEFVSHFAGSAEFVNREEDVGDPGLRYAKESYHPHALLEKYVVERG